MDKNSEEVVEQQIQEFSELLQKTKQALWNGEYLPADGSKTLLVSLAEAFLFVATNEQFKRYGMAFTMLQELDKTVIEDQIISAQERQQLRHEFLDGWSADVVAVLPQVCTASVQEDEDNVMPVDVVAEEPEEEPEEEPWCVMCGNPVGGFDVYGPFSNNDEAVNWADGLIDKDWWIMRLQKPGPV